MDNFKVRSFNLLRDSVARRGMPSLKKGSLAWGIQYGNLWWSYGYSSKQGAEIVASKFNSDPPSIEANFKRDLPVAITPYDGNKK